MLHQNSANMQERVNRCNQTTLAVLGLFTTHPSVAQVWFPSLVHSAACYERCKRTRGGYGNTIIVVFREPETAACFYDRLECCKTASFGTDFTMAVPYAELTYSAWDLQRCLKYAVPRHMLRLNIGLEDEGVVRRWMVDALEEVGRRSDTMD